MSSNSWNQTLATAKSDGATLSNSAAPTSLLPSHAKYTMPAGLLKIGDVMRIMASGRISTASLSPGTLTFDVRADSTIIFNGGASGSLATSATNLSWALEIMLTCREIGSSAVLMGQGRLFTAALSATTPIMLLPTSAPAVGNTFDSMASPVIDLFATWGTASASNSLVLHQFALTLDT